MHLSKCILFVAVTNNIIEEATYSGIIDPSAEWHTLNHRGPKARITYRVRVKCDNHYYNATCTKFCRPRDDKFGHYRCDANGDKECIEGWKGVNCETGKIFFLKAFFSKDFKLRLNAGTCSLMASRCPVSTDRSCWHVLRSLIVMIVKQQQPDSLLALKSC